MLQGGLSEIQCFDLSPKKAKIQRFGNHFGSIILTARVVVFSLIQAHHNPFGELACHQVVASWTVWQKQIQDEHFQSAWHTFERPCLRVSLSYQPIVICLWNWHQTNIWGCLTLLIKVLNDCKLDFQVKCNFVTFSYCQYLRFQSHLNEYDLFLHACEQDFIWNFLSEKDSVNYMDLV